ncbi:MAG: SPASM domain-containing protein, partial [Candidatus Odinarchaeota archaeon]
LPKLKELQPDCVSLSLDGAISETHDYIRGIKGAYDKVLESIKLLQKEDIPVSVITTVSKLNIKELILIRDLLLNRKIAWQIQIALPIGRFPRDLVISRKEFYGVAMFIASSLQKFSIKELPVIGAHCFGFFSILLPELGLEPWIGCQAGKSVLGIQSNGNIKGCLTLPDDFIEGNIRTTRLSSILNNKFELKYNQYSNKIGLKNYCATCKMFRKCHAGCLGTMLALNTPETPYCLRAIEKDIFKNMALPFRWKIDSKISKFKYLYQKILFK